MCFVLEDSLTPRRIADTDIEIWKVFNRSRYFANGNLVSLCLSPFQDFNYKLGEKYSTRFSFSKDKNRILKGFHSYRYGCSARKVLSDFMMNYPAILTKNLEVIKCIIPKGSTYYYHPYTGEVVSNKIIIGNDIYTMNDYLNETYW